jgi:hypothetical protein
MPPSITLTSYPAMPPALPCVRHQLWPRGIISAGVALPTLKVGHQAARVHTWLTCKGDQGQR